MIFLKIIFRKLWAKSPILIPESIPSIWYPSIAQKVPIIQIVTLTEIVTPFLASRKCGNNEWGKYYYNYYNEYKINH